MQERNITRSKSFHVPVYLLYLDVETLKANSCDHKKVTSIDPDNNVHYALKRMHTTRKML